MKKLTTDGKLIARAVKDSSVVEVFNTQPFCIWDAEVSSKLMENALFSLLSAGLGRNQDQEAPASGREPEGRGQSDCLCGKARLVSVPDCGNSICASESSLAAADCAAKVKEIN